MGSAGFPALAVATAVAFLAGVWATERMTALGEDKDPSEIVIDEVVGMWIALWPLSAGPLARGGGSVGIPVAGLGGRVRDVPAVRRVEAGAGWLGGPPAGGDGRDAG